MIVNVNGIAQFWQARPAETNRFGQPRAASAGTGDPDFTIPCQAYTPSVQAVDVSLAGADSFTNQEITLKVNITNKAIANAAVTLRQNDRVRVVDRLGNLLYEPHTVQSIQRRPTFTSLLCTRVDN